MAERRGGGRPGPAGRVERGPAGPAQPAPQERFGADLLRELGRGGENTVLSPASVAATLGMALLGARGETAEAIAGVLRGAGPEQTAGLLGQAARGLAGGQVALHAPAMIWVQSGVPLAPGFADAVGRLAAAARRADFRSRAEQARVDINAAISERTAGMIGELLAPGGVRQDTRLVLAGAVYLKAAWASPFPAGATARAPFRTAGGRETDVPMMRLVASLGYRRADGYQAVILPYQGSRLVMAVLLPDGPLAPLEKRLEDGGLSALLAGAAAERMRLGLPRFRQSSRLELRPALSRLGMAVAFGGSADFSGITAAETLAIGPVAHMAFIDVGEQGTEAAAATAATMIAMSRAAPPPLEVTVDRPFLFAVVDTATRLPLFLGRVADPAAG